MNGPLHSDDAVTRVMHGQPVDFVPVALAYEHFGRLQYLRVERNWQLWHQRLEALRTEVLSVSYEMYLAHEMEIETGILAEVYRRPAWLALSPRKMLSGLFWGLHFAAGPWYPWGMNRIVDCVCCLRGCLGVLLQLVGYLLRFCWALLLPRAVTAAQLLAFQSQLAAELNRSSGRRKRHSQFSPAFRMLWVVLSKFLNGWEELVHVMKPETVKRWHSRAFRAWWRWKSKPGRKPVAQEIQQLIRRLSKENPLWGAERIRDTLLLLGYDAPGEDTVRKYMVKPRRPRPATTNWLPFLRNHLDCSWAIDFLSVTTLRFQVLYVFLVFDHARREVRHFAITANPTMEWVIEQLREAMPFGEQPRYLHRDNDAIYGDGVRAFLISCGILEVRTAYRSPWQNPYIERFIGTLRRELLDHVIVLNHAHLERLLKELIEDYYHTARPHQGLAGETPMPQAPPGAGELISVPVVGGLHHRYYRAAA